VVIWFTRIWSLNDLADHTLMVSLGGNLVFYLIQAVLTPRVARKNYRSFSVHVVHESGERSRRLTVKEGGWLWVWILRPQIALAVVSNLAASYFVGNPDALGGISTFTRWPQFLIVGPNAIGFALQMMYAGFWFESDPS
jgi:hypothetical protein